MTLTTALLRIPTRHDAQRIIPSVTRGDVTGDAMAALNFRFSCWKRDD